MTTYNRSKVVNPFNLTAFRKSKHALSRMGLRTISDSEIATVLKTPFAFKKSADKYQTPGRPTVYEFNGEVDGQMIRVTAAIDGTVAIVTTVLVCNATQTYAVRNR